MQSKRNNQGFSLIELLIVISVIVIIAAIGVPSLLSARRAANEGSAQSSLRTIHSAQATYQQTSGLGNFGSLNELLNARLIDPALGAGQKSGYIFVVTETDLVAGTSPARFKVTANPQVTSGASQSGTRKFGTREDGVMHGQTDALDTPLTDAELALLTNVMGN
ncbi:MAG TPA: prepilin-type N-terminal cleavage/methylation domain-containing protein [Pyrinomonadaceae bacterium]|nr:prepilin-type N-terminal cleavage/methylation domain-containing protein [Pyrinomonadaceae bacterium]